MDAAAGEVAENAGSLEFAGPTPPRLLHPSGPPSSGGSWGARDCHNLMIVAMKVAGEQCSHLSASAGENDFQDATSGRGGSSP
jgi:hypothetical protein